MKNILVINGHPNKNSINFALAEAYYNGAKNGGADANIIHIADLEFNPNLQFGYQQRIELEPDLIMALEKIKAADHLVWVHPVWWGGMPALMKGFIDRLFLPGITFQYRADSVWWDKLLKGKTARIITTMDQPGWYYRLIFGRPSINQLKKSVLEFCVVKPVKVSHVGIVKNSSTETRAKWLVMATRMGNNFK